MCNTVFRGLFFFVTITIFSLSLSCVCYRSTINGAIRAVHMIHAHDSYSYGPYVLRMILFIRMSCHQHDRQRMGQVKVN